MRTKFLFIVTLLLGALHTNAQHSGQWRDSLNTVIRQSELYPDSINLQLQKASLYLQSSDWEKAAEVCNEILLKQETNLPALFYRAWANNMRRYENARSDYETFLKIAPDNMESRLGLAYTYTKLGRNNEAMDQMNRLVEMFPDSSTVYAARSGLEKDMSQYETALYDIEKALSLDPANHDYIIEKVGILLNLGRKDDARRTLNYGVSKGIPMGLLKEWYSKCK